MKILICEDNVIVAMSMEMTLEDLGHDSAGIVTSSDACRTAAETRDPDLVIVDLDLADGPTGLALVGWLKERGIASIIVSGQADALDDDHGAACVLVKPVDEARLGRAIASLADSGDALSPAES